MKKNQFNSRKMAAAIVVISAIACSIAWIRPSFSYPEKDKAPQVGTNSEPVKHVDSTANISEETQLVRQLESDGRINQITGFVVEKRQNMLFINGRQVPDDIAGKYISGMKKDIVRVQVYSLMKRQMLHPEASFIQLLLPVMLSSPCVDYKQKEPGC